MRVVLLLVLLSLSFAISIEQVYREDLRLYEGLKEDAKVLRRAVVLLDRGKEKRAVEELRKLRFLSARKVLRDYRKQKDLTAKKVFLRLLLRDLEKKLRKMKPVANVNLGEWAILVYKGFSAERVCRELSSRYGYDYEIRDGACYLVGFKDREKARELARAMKAIGVVEWRLSRE